MLQVKQQIRAGVKSCGYKGDLLKESYHYFDGRTDRTAEIVGFYQSIYNSSTACIAAIDKTKLNGNKLETELLPYQLLGCPVLLIYDNSGLQFWKNSGIQITLHELVELKQLNDFFGRYKKEFSPESIYRAKVISRVKRDYQLSFADIGGLMGIVEEKEGKYLSELTERAIRSLKTNCKGVKEDSTFDKWLFQAAFWLIGAKILTDKQVERFKNLKISNIDDLVERVKRHYNASESLDISNTIQKSAFGKVAKEIVEPVSSFAHLTTESLAYVYENTLTSKETRKILGTHATPSWLVNYIVWELIDWVEDIPQKNRIILEPACGHAPFLTAGAKLLSSPLIYKGREEDRHKYLKEHLIGIDKDDFAEEIARLALTLADIPNPNGWNIKHSDIYENDILKKAAQKATILFCNPPFENFTREDKLKYKDRKTANKAAEVLAKTLPHMPNKSVFGVILPQGFLNNKNLQELRRYIFENCEIRTICNLPDSVFAKAGHPSTVLLGRKSKGDIKTTYLRIPKNKIDHFKNTYQADVELVDRNTFYEAKGYSFRIPELKEVWDYCTHFPKLKEYVEIGRGIEYKSGLDIDDIMRHTQFAGSKLGFYCYEEDTLIERLPTLVWLNVSEKTVNTYAKGMICQPFILLNRIRSSRTPWRLRAWIDFEGHPCGKAFLTVVSSRNISLYAIWALLNSPFANAYTYDHCMAQDNNEGILKNIPVNLEYNDLSKIDSLAKEYFSLDSEEYAFRDIQSLNEDKMQCLLAIDAEILRLYNLPPRLEKKLLDFFEGVQRKGVAFKFERYYPAGFDSYIPLNIFISEEFNNSTVGNITKWVEENRTPAVIEALEKATEDFQGE